MVFRSFSKYLQTITKSSLRFLKIQSSCQPSYSNSLNPKITQSTNYRSQKDYIAERSRRIYRSN
jgi:hypothetical protein